MSVRGVDEYCPVNAEEYCEERGIECPFLLESLGEDANVRLCPMTPQLDKLKKVLVEKGVVKGDER